MRFSLPWEDGYRSFNNGLVVQPEFVNVVLPGTHQGMDFKSGLDMGGGFISMKASSGGFDNNPALGLPIGMNTVLLFEAKTCALRCIMDGTWITGCRTAAAGAHLGKVHGQKGREDPLCDWFRKAGTQAAFGHHEGAEV